jgi:hypothetical protein
MASKVQPDINARVQEAWLVPRARVSGLPSISQTDHTCNRNNTLESFQSSRDSNLPNVSTPYYRINYARRIVQLVPLVISFPLFVFLILYYQSNPNKRHACTRFLNYVSSYPEVTLVFLGGKTKTVR